MELTEQNKNMKEAKNMRRVISKKLLYGINFYQVKSFSS